MTQTLEPPTTEKVADPYDEQVNSENFDLAGYMGQFDLRMFNHPQTRRALTKYDPLLFAIIYLRHHISTDGTVSFADPHFEWAKRARGWIAKNTLKGDRHAYIAPRDLGKSTWWFLILPMWAAAHGHIRFAVAFAHSGGQAETHLHAFRSELGDNQLLREDFPLLCAPARKPNGKTTADTIQMLRTRSGFAFAARGVDAANLGIKEKDTRPDLLLLDDVEPDEASYSDYQMKKRRGTIVEAILPMNLRAHVVLVGTVTMPGSIVHQLVAKTRGDTVEKWVDEEQFTPHHHQPILSRDDGTERSIWPYKWPIEFLRSIRRTRSYAKNFLNDPVGNDGGYWTVEDFTHLQLPNVTRQMISVDPAITTKKQSDPTGVAILSFAPAYVLKDEHQRVKQRVPSRCQVDFAAEVRLVGENLRQYLLKLLLRYPNVRLILVEANQGGEHWQSILHHMPVRVVIVYSTVPKEVRASNLLELYQHQPPRVVHGVPLALLEQQMASFPNGKDDLVDAVGAVALRLLGSKAVEGTVMPR